MRNIFQLFCIALIVSVAGCVEGDSNSGNGFYMTVSGDSVGYIEFVKSTGGSPIELWYTGFGISSNGYFTGIDAVIPHADHSPPLKYLPPSIGESWTYTGDSNGYTVNSTTTVTSVTETVSVSAGTFTNCVKTVITYSYPNGYSPGQPYRLSQERWFAPGIGPVKVVMWRSDSTSYTAELSTYSNITADPADYFPLGLNFQWTFSSSLGETATWEVTSLL